jgi:hypothetical protein
MIFANINYTRYTKIVCIQTNEDLYTGKYGNAFRL